MEDYAAYKIKAQLKMKKLDKELVRDELAQAALSVDEVIVELRLTKAAITDLMEKRNERD